MDLIRISQVFYRAIPMPKLQRQTVLQVDFQEPINSALGLKTAMQVGQSKHKVLIVTQVVYRGNNYSNSVIKNSYATGAVSGIRNVGGLLGNNNSSTVENSYATGQVTRTSGSAITFGGLVGRTGGTIKNSYYDKTSTGQANAVGDGTGTVTATDITVANRYSRNGYSNLGTWSLLAGTTNVLCRQRCKQSKSMGNDRGANPTIYGANIVPTLTTCTSCSSWRWI